MPATYNRFSMINIPSHLLCVCHCPASSQLADVLYKHTLYLLPSQLQTITVQYNVCSCTLPILFIQLMMQIWAICNTMYSRVSCKFIVQIYCSTCGQLHMYKLLQSQDSTMIIFSWSHSQMNALQTQCSHIFMNIMQYVMGCIRLQYVCHIPVCIHAIRYLNTAHLIQSNASLVIDDACVYRSVVQHISQFGRSQP